MTRWGDVVVNEGIDLRKVELVERARDAEALPAVAPPPATNLFVLAKTRQRMAPFPVELSHLTPWVTALADEEGRGTYVGSHVYPFTEGIVEGARLPDELNLAELPHYYSLRFECDGEGPCPLDDACMKMQRALQLLSHLPHWSFLRFPDPIDDECDLKTRFAIADLRAGRAEAAARARQTDSALDGDANVERFFTFFCTGGRSVYAVARECSAVATTGWDAAVKDVFEQVNARAGEELVDLGIYRTPKAPGRALYTRHEKGTWFNKVPWEWVRDRALVAISDRCENSTNPAWADDLLDATGMLRRAGGAVYDALTFHVKTLRFADEVRQLSMPPRLPVTRGRIDFVGLLRQRGYYVAREKDVRGTMTYLLDRCPFCGKGPTHAWVSEYGRLKCFAEGCIVTEGLSARGDDGWLRRLNIEIPKADDDGEADAQDAVDHYPDAREIVEAVDIGQARGEIVRRLADFLKE